MYCLYSVFFSFLIPYTLFPGTFVCFVLRNPEKPIIFRISNISGSSSTSIASASWAFVVVEGALDVETDGSEEEVEPLGFESAGLGILDDAFESEVTVFCDRGPVGGAAWDC